MESLNQYFTNKAYKLSNTAGKILAAPLKSDKIRALLKRTVKGGIMAGRFTLKALEEPRKEWVKLFKEARQERHSPSSSEGQQIPIRRRSHNKRELNKLSAEELYEIAREKDITGRSKMNKKELIEAIRNKRSAD